MAKKNIVVDEQVNETVVKKEPIVKEAKVSNCYTLNFRKTANGEIIDSIPVDSTVTVVKEDEEWTKIKYEGKTGFVMSEYLTIE